MDWRDATKPLFDKIKSYWLRYNDDYIFGRQSIMSILILILIIQFGCFNAPDWTSIINLSTTEAKAIASNLFSAYISILGVVLAISAIILAIVQISNHKLTTTKLVFTRTMFMPLVYYGLINIIYLSLLQLLHQTDDKVNFEEFYIQTIIASIYVFAFFIILTFFVFFRTFRYLNFTNIVDDYLNDVLNKIKLGTANDFLSTKGSEVHLEILRTIENEDNVMLAKLLQSIYDASEINPNETYLFSLDGRMAEWHCKAYQEHKHKDKIWGTLVSSWRRLRAATITSGNDNIKFKYSQVPSLTISLIQGDKKDAASLYALHLKELIVYSTLSVSENKIYNASFTQAANYLKDFILIINTLIDKLDFDSLKTVYNQFIYIIDDYESRLEILNNFDENIENIETKAEITSLLLKIYNAALSIFAYYVFRVQFYPLTAKYEERIYNLLISIFSRKNDSIPLDQIANLEENEIVDWRNWIWNLQDREDGIAYILDSEGSIISFGLLHIYIKHPYINPRKMDLNLAEHFKWIKNHKLEFINSIPSINDLDLEERIIAINELTITLQQNEEEERVKRIAASLRSEEKIQYFKDVMRDQWKNSRNIYNIFNYFNAIEKNPNEKLKQVGTPRIDLERGRVLFIEGKEYTWIQGIDWGRVVNREIERILVQSIMKAEIKETEATSIIEAFDNVINRYSEIVKTHLVAFLPSDKIYQWHVDLINSGRYQAIDKSSNIYPFEVIGIFDNMIFVVRISKTDINKQVIVLNLPEALHYQQRIRSEYIDNQLEVRIELSDDVKVANKENNQIADNDSKAVAPANAIITVQEIMNFKINDPQHIFPFKISG